MRQNGEGRHNTQTHKTLQRPYSAPIPCTQDGYHGHWLPAISPVLCVSNSARKPNRNLGCGYDTALGGMEEPGGLKRPIYLFQLQQRATLFPFQLFKPTGSGLLTSSQPPTKLETGLPDRTAQNPLRSPAERNGNINRPLLGTFLLEDIEPAHTAEESQIKRGKKPDHHSASPQQHHSRGSSLSAAERNELDGEETPEQDVRGRGLGKMSIMAASALMPAVLRR